MAERWTDGWFEDARALVEGRAGDPAVSLRVAFESDLARWHLVVEQGAISQWAMGPLDQPDLILRVAGGSEHQVLTGGDPDGEHGTTALASCEVVLGDGSTTAPSPMDIDPTLLGALPEVPGADLLVQYHFAEGPFGAVGYWWRFASGRSESMGWGEAAEPDVSVWITYADMVAVRRGQLSIYESLETRGAQVEGGVGPLMLLAGLEETPELHDAELACGASGDVLASLARLRWGPAHRDAFDQLAADLR